MESTDQGVSSAFQLQLNSPRIKTVLVFTNQALVFRSDFQTSLSISADQLKATLRPLENCSPLDFLRAQVHLHYLNDLVVGECRYNAREANEVENEYYRSLSHPEARKLIAHYHALVVPRMAIRDILSDVDPGLKFYFLAPQSMHKEFLDTYGKLQLLKAPDNGNKDLEHTSLKGKKMVALTLKEFVCLRLLGIERATQLTGVIYRNGLYCDESCATDGLKELIKEYKIEETELLLKYFLRIKNSSTFLDKLGDKARLIHEIEYLNEVNHYCYFRAVRCDKVLYIRHNDSPSLAELQSMFSVPTDKPKKYLILEAQDLAAHNLVKVVEVELLKYIKAEEIDLIDLKGDSLLIVNYVSTRNYNGQIFDLLCRLRKVQKISLPEAVWLALTERPHYKSMLSKLSNSLNIICTLSKPHKGASQGYFMTFRGCDGNPFDIVNHLSRFIREMQIYYFEIDVKNASEDATATKFQEVKLLASKLKIRDPVVKMTDLCIELSGVVLSELHLEETLAQLRGCLDPDTFDIMEIKESFEDVEIELEDEELGQTTLHSEWSRSQIEVESEGDNSKAIIHEGSVLNQDSFNVCSVIDKEPSELRDQSGDSLLDIIPEGERIARLPLLLTEDIDAEKLRSEASLFNQDGLWCVRGDGNFVRKQLDILSRLLTEAYKQPQEESNERFNRKLIQLQKDHPELLFEPIDENLRRRSKLQWRRSLIGHLKKEQIEAFEGFCKDSEPVRLSELAKHPRLSYGFIYESFDQHLTNCYHEFTVSRKT